MENLHRNLWKEGKKEKREPIKGHIRKTGRQKAEILHRDVSKEREGMREKEEEQRS